MKTIIQMLRIEKIGLNGLDKPFFEYQKLKFPLVVGENITFYLLYSYLDIFLVTGKPELNPFLRAGLIPYEFDRRNSVIDSMVCLRYVPKEYLTSNMSGILNHEKTIYETLYPNEEITPLLIEYFEFHKSLYEVNKLYDKNKLEEGDNGRSHSRFITPILYHSETRMRVFLQSYFNNYDGHKIIPKLLKDVTNKLQWRILVIDDKIDVENLSPKAKILCGWLMLLGRVFRSTGRWDEFEEIKSEEIGNATDFQSAIEGLKFSKGSNEVSFIIHFCPNVEQAIMEFKKYSYDIVMLDYLLDKKDPLSEDRNLGHKLFDVLKNDFSPDMKTGPFGKFWILPESAHNSSMMDELKASGISFNNPIWHISRSGDPINTPYLFLYSLFELMEYQVDMVYLNSNEMIGFFKSFVNDIDPRDVWSRTNYLHVTNASELEQQARVSLNRFIYKFGTFEMLQEDEKNGSLLAKSMIKINKKEDELLFSRIRKLLYMLAYRNYNNLAEVMAAIFAIEDSVDKSLMEDPEFKKFRNNIIMLLDFK